MALDPDKLAKEYIRRIREAGKMQLGESHLAKTASTDARRQRVLDEVATIDTELQRLRNTGHLDFGEQDEVVQAIGDEFGVPEDIKRILKEASIRALGNLSGYWARFFAGVGT